MNSAKQPVRPLIQQQLSTDEGYHFLFHILVQIPLLLPFLNTTTVAPQRWSLRARGAARCPAICTFILNVLSFSLVIHSSPRSRGHLIHSKPHSCRPASGKMRSLVPNDLPARCLRAHLPVQGTWLPSRLVACPDVPIATFASLSGGCALAAPHKTTHHCWETASRAAHCSLQFELERCTA